MNEDKPSLGIQRLSWVLSTLSCLTTAIAIITCVTDSNPAFLITAPIFWGTVAFTIPFTAIRLTHWIYRGFKIKR